MTILIDADGCPVVDLTLQIAKRFGVPVIILCDTAHQIEPERREKRCAGCDSVRYIPSYRAGRGTDAGI